MDGKGQLTRRPDENKNTFRNVAAMYSGTVPVSAALGQRYSVDLQIAQLEQPWWSLLLAGTMSRSVAVLLLLFVQHDGKKSLELLEIREKHEYATL